VVDVRDREDAGVVEATELLGLSADRSGGLLVRARLVGIPREDREQVRELLERARDPVVGPGHPARTGRRRRRAATGGPSACGGGSPPGPTRRNADRR